MKARDLIANRLGPAFSVKSVDIDGFVIKAVVERVKDGRLYQARYDLNMDEFSLDPLEEVVSQ